jgi:hypothetical protein
MSFFDPRRDPFIPYKVQSRLFLLGSAAFSIWLFRSIFLWVTQ